MMKQIYVTKNQDGSPDGNTVIKYKADKSYPMPDELADVFIREKWGYEIKKKKNKKNKKNEPKETDGPNEPEDQG